MAESKRAKKARTDGGAADCFAAGLLESAAARGREYAAAEPFPHHSIAPFCAEELLAGVRSEIVERLHFTHKETDIYKYHQSGDLANLDRLPDSEQSQLPCLRRLRDAIYSREFRDFVSAVTGCGPLSGSRTDMSTNRYKPGDHLLLHDDAIGDRRVSYIIYLPDPATSGDWTPADGGHLELYPRESHESWAPAVQPARQVPPQWNQMVLFTVQPGQSHHSVEEVCAGERTSIQGWFHFPQPGEPGYSPDQMQRAWAGGAESTLSQIAAREQRQDGGSAAGAFVTIPRAAVAELDVADAECLRPFVNPEYLDPTIMRQAADRFASESHISLGAFLNANTAAALEQALQAADASDGIEADRPRITPHGAGEHGPWRAAGPPVVRRFLHLDSTAAAAADSPLAALRDELFDTPAFARWLAAVTGLALCARRGLVRRFRPGLDYTLASPDGATVPVLDAVLCLAVRPTAWADGTVGGYHCYIDGGDGDASNDGSVFRITGNDNDAVLLTNPAAWNTLSLAMREPGVVHFVKYVSAAAPGSRWDVSYEFQAEEEEDDGDDDQ
ncbi:putative component of NuA3 histone acetyltransferase complex [Coemansia spiralis]|nr:putative component of NuA3 histone acetyltransferase complex [Coemansia spiralis]